MKSVRKLAAALILGAAGTLAIAGPASAGTWFLEASACPDLREDRRDSRYNHGRRDRMEDFRDRQVIDCPPHAWHYQPDFNERRYGVQRGVGAFDGTPGIVYRSHYGGFYRVNYWGERQPLDVQIIQGPQRRPLPWRGVQHRYGRYYN